MSPLAVALALCAAAMHATWNAVLRAGRDRLRSVTIMAVVGLIVAAPLAAALAPPRPASYPFIAVSCGLQVGYSLVLAELYRHGDLSQVYPVVRGSVPFLVLAGAYGLGGQRVGAHEAAGMACIGLGILGLASGRGRLSPRALAAALVTALFIAAYVTTDASGVRASGNPVAYAAWIFVVYGLAMPAVYAAARGRSAMRVEPSEALKGAAGGVVALLSYGATLFALSLAPAGPVTALRETSVAFAALIGRFALGEPLTARRGIACALVSAGAVAIAARG